MNWSPMFSSSVPVILQSEAPECGVACVAMVASFYGFKTDLSAMRQRLSTSLKGVTLKQISQVAESMQMTARGVQLPLRAFRHDGFWQCMDNPREMEQLNKAWAEGNAPWKVW